MPSNCQVTFYITWIFPTPLNLLSEPKLGLLVVLAPKDAVRSVNVSQCMPLGVLNLVAEPLAMTILRDGSVQVDLEM
jgi:hypothetical protein